MYYYILNYNKIANKKDIFMKKINYSKHSGGNSILQAGWEGGGNKNIMNERFP